MMRETETKLPRKIWLSSPTMHGSELAYVRRAYETNWMSTVGENINTVEAELAARIGCANGVALSCGTAALHLAVKLAGVRPGDRVFCSDMTFGATANPILYEHATPIFIDTERESWNMDPHALELAFSRYPDVKTLIVADLYGVPAKLDEIAQIAERHGAVLIEDAAEALGATYKGKPVGSFGRYNAISFNGNKIITGSSGGMLLTDDAEAADRARKWSTQSREAAPWYQHEEIGYNYRMSNVIAGVVRGQLPYLDEHIAAKKEIYERYRRGLAGLPVSMNPFDDESCSPNYWLSCLLINEDAMCRQDRSESEARYVSEQGRSCPTEILETLASIGAEGRPIWKPMHLQPVFRSYPFVSCAENGATDVGSDIFRRGLCLPSDIKMTSSEQDLIIRTIHRCFDESEKESNRVRKVL